MIQRTISHGIKKHITTMSRYNATFPFSVAFPPQAMTNVLAEWFAKQEVEQAHIAGTPSFFSILLHAD